MTSRPRPVALVVMPWISAGYGSAAIAGLKSYLLKHRIPVEDQYLNLRLASKMGFQLYQFFALNGAYTGVSLVGEWFFSRPLFGPAGTGEMRAGFEDMMERPPFREGVERLARNFSFTPPDLERFMEGAVSQFLADCLGSVSWERYRLVGFSSVFWNNVASLALSKGLKERFPELSIVFGGANVQDVMGLEMLRSFPWLDYVVDGEGEEALVALVRNLSRDRPFDPVPGVSFRKGAEVFANLRDGHKPVAMDDLPAPNYRGFLRSLREEGFLEKGLEPRILFESSRGCWFGAKSHCTFCGLNGKEMAFRSKSPDKLLREVLDLHARYKAIHLHCVDNILDMRYFETFLPMLRERIRRDSLDISVFYETKSNLKKEQIALLAECGVRTVVTGIESVHSGILNLIRKGVSPIQNVQTLKFCKQHRIHALWFLLYGIPGEKPEYYDEMLKTLPLLTHLAPPPVLRIIVDRFSPYHSSPEAFGLGDLRPIPVYGCLYPSRVDLTSLAYHFEYGYRNGQPDPESYIGPFREFVERWLLNQDRMFLFYSRGLGFLEIEDYRLRSGQDREPSFRKFKLQGLQAELYLACDSYRSFQSVWTHVCERFGGRPSEREVRAALDDLVGRQIMYREGGRYLSLALPRDSVDTGVLEGARHLDPYYNKWP